MSGHKEKKRKLRSSDIDAKNTQLYNFDNANKLLYGNGRIRIDFNSATSTENPYQHYGPNGWGLTKVPKRKAAIKRQSGEMPRRRRKYIVDPLGDDVYDGFHRRMKKEERSRVVTDRSRMYFDMDNVKSQLELLRQHDWRKHLPQITAVSDRSNEEELLTKRRATMREIEKTLAKFAGWEARTAALAAEVKQFGSSAKTSHADDTDADDADEAILSTPLKELRAQRKRQRIAKYGQPVRILLGNGCSIRFNPYLVPKVAVERKEE